ncbi:MAG: hypothetical protein ABEJ88_02625 [Halobacterium sp.]
MSDSYTRRSALAVFGTGLAALTGAATRPSQCSADSAPSAADCGGALSLTGADPVRANGSNPRFVAANDGGGPVSVRAGEWRVYRREAGGWRLRESGDGGATTTLAPGEETAWVLLLGDDGGRSSVFTTTASTTRYVGPVSLAPGEYAFLVRGDRDGDSVSAAASFTVRR